jgi:hypothetical protein
LCGVNTLATLELGIVNQATIWNRRLVDALALAPFSAVGIPSIGSVNASGRDRRRIRQHAQTLSRRLASVSALAAFELRIIGSGTVGSRQLVDAVANSPVNIGGLVPDINASVGSRRDGWRIRKIGETSSGSLGGIITLAAFELGVVNCAAVGHGCGVDALAFAEISIVGIPSIGSIDARRRYSRRIRKIFETSSRFLGCV